MKTTIGTLLRTVRFGLAAWILVALNAGAVDITEATVIRPEVPKQAPTWQMKSVEGKTVKSTEFTNKVVLLNFWATWCVPCQAEIPSFIELQAKYGKEGLAVLGASLDKSGAKSIKSFARKQGINYPVLVATDQIQDLFGETEILPTTFVIDQKGRIISQYIGLARKELLEADVKALLKR